MKIKAKIKDASFSWDEEFECSSKENAIVEIKETINHFNSTLRKHDIPREFVELLDEVDVPVTKLAREFIVFLTHKKQNALCDSTIKENYKRACNELRLIEVGKKTKGSSLKRMFHWYVNGNTLREFKKIEELISKSK